MKNLLAASLTLILVLPLGAADKKKKGQYDPTSDDVDALIHMKTVLGKVSKLEGSSKGFTLIYETQVPDQKKIDQANRPLVRKQNSLNNQLNRAQNEKNPNKRAARIQSIANQLANVQAQAQANVLKYTKTVRKDFPLQGTSKTTVRTMKLPVQYDDKGNIKEYTKKEKEELKGKDKKAPGYEATWESLADKQIVKVTVRAHKKKKKESTEDKEDAKDKKADTKKEDAKADDVKKEDAKPKTDADKTKDAGEDDDLLDDDRPIVTRIIILKDPESDQTTDKKKKNQ